MKKLTIALLFVPFILSAQTPNPLVDISRYHDDNRKDEMIDNNFQDITNGTYEFTDFNYKPPHGEMSFSDSSVTINVIEDEFHKVTNPTNTLFYVSDADNITLQGDSITITVAGDYMMMASLSFSGTASDVWDFAVLKNTLLSSPMIRRTTSQTDVGNVSLPFYFESLKVGDDLALVLMNTASGDDPTVVACSWVIWRLHK